MYSKLIIVQVLLLYSSSRRIYHGLLRLSDAKTEQTSDISAKSRKREVGKLVNCIALGSDIKIQGKHKIINVNNCFIVKVWFYA